MKGTEKKQRLDASCLCNKGLLFQGLSSWDTALTLHIRSILHWMEPGLLYTIVSVSMSVCVCVYFNVSWEGQILRSIPLYSSCMNSMKRQKDRTLKGELPMSVGAQYATGDQWRNNSGG